MIYINLTKIKRAFQKKRNLNDLIKLLKRTIYSYSEDIILVKDLNDIKEFPLKNGLEIQSIEKKDIPALLLFRKQAGNYERHSLRSFNEYFKNNCNGLIAKLNGEIIGYIWWGNNKMQTNFSNISSKFYVKEIKLAPSEAYGFDFFIDSKHRGNGRAIDFKTRFFSVLHNMGYERTFGVVEADNIPARWIYKLVGYKEIRKVKVQRFLKFILLRDKKFFFDEEALG